MRKYLGPLLILFTIILTVFFWSMTEPLKTVSVNRQYSQLVAGIMMICFA
ncbi:MAG: hypothetical protein GX434_09985 [Peptococcaceae bacterium]|nr:hypothetical protein [Peptococcaceae bacterium]